jgi:hypothetical protein
MVLVLDKMRIRLAALMKYFDIACIETDTLVETNHDGMYHVICYPSISNKDNKITFLQVLKLMALVSYIELIIIQHSAHMVS